jgi:uncharacterized delta-60 repeat protein
VRAFAKLLHGRRRVLRVAEVSASGAGPAASDLSGEPDAGFDRAGLGRMVVAEAGLLQGVAAQAGGGIIGVGFADGNALVFRLRPDGTRDTAFGTRRLTAPGMTATFGYAVAEQRDDRILVAGTAIGVTGGEIGVWRLLASGALDASFGTEGFARFGGRTFGEVAFDVAVDAEGRVVVAGYTSNGDDMILVRFTGTGVPDAAFNHVNGTGVPYFQFASTSYASAHGLAVQPDGKIVVTGLETGATGLPVYRVIPGDPNNGSAAAALDSHFGDGDGRTVVHGFHPYGTGLSLQRDGGIVAIGMTPGGGGHEVGSVVRLTPGGAVDAGYGSATGLPIRVPDAAGGYLTAVAALPTGGVAVTGIAVVDGVDRPFVAKLDDRGGPDEAMGPDGVRLLNPHDRDINAVVVQPDGRIVAAGITKPGDATGGSTFGGVVYRLPGDLEGSGCGHTETRSVRRLAQ